MVITGGSGNLKVLTPNTTLRVHVYARVFVCASSYLADFNLFLAIDKSLPLSVLKFSVRSNKDFQPLMNMVSSRSTETETMTAIIPNLRLTPENSQERPF